MIDHITIRVSDLEVTKKFYLKTLRPLGYELMQDGDKFIGLGKGGKADVWFTIDESVSGPVHIAWQASSRAEVEAFYQEALAAGGRDNGAPDTRSEYHENYYGAFVLDPDGNNIEAVYGN